MIYLLTQYLSPTLVLGFTVERYIAVCHPFRKERLCQPGRARRVVLGLAILCGLLAVIQVGLILTNMISNMKHSVKTKSIRFSVAMIAGYVKYLNDDFNLCILFNQLCSCVLLIAFKKRNGNIITYSYLRVLGKFRAGLL